MPSEFIEYKGEKFYLQKTGRYFSSGRHGKNAKERLLHRRVWTDNFGPIPEGTEIHHIDGDWRNNDPKNLELKSRTKHRAERMLSRMAEPEFRARALQALRDADRAAAAWHASPEGREWHRQNGLQAWEKRTPTAATCTQCAKPYETYFEARSKFCSSACTQKAAQSRYMTAVGTCFQCGTRFAVNRYLKKPPECCSRRCASRRHHGHPPTKPGDVLW